MTKGDAVTKGEAVVEGVAVDYQLDIAKVLQDVAKVVIAVRTILIDMDDHQNRCQYSTLSSFSAHLRKADNASSRIKWSHLMERSL